MLGSCGLGPGLGCGLGAGFPGTVHLSGFEVLIYLP